MIKSINSNQERVGQICFRFEIKVYKIGNGES